MSKRIVELLLLGTFLILAVLLYRSTANFPSTVQGSTAMYVRFLAVALGLLCALELFFSLKKKQTEAKKMDLAPRPVRFWGLLVLLVIYSALQPTLGFYLASMLFLPPAMLLLGGRKPLTIGLSTAAVILFVYLVFDRLLQVALPSGTIF
jgi:putative tricarboxylic transport membrane protein